MKIHALIVAVALGVPVPAAAQDGGDTLLVSTAWLAERLDEPGLVILQMVIRDAEYGAGHIPGGRPLADASIARNMDGMVYELPPVEELVDALEAAGVSDEDRIIVYGHPLHAGRLFFTLEYLGHRGRVSLLDGGLERWRAEGRPVSTERPHYARGTFTPRARRDVVVDDAWVYDHLEYDGYALVDARPESQFRRGHVPGAGNLFYRHTLSEGDAPVLEDPETLRELLERAGVDPDDKVVTYCAIGMRASFLYFVARYLGYDVSMYDGSFSDWSQQRDYPVTRAR